MLNGQFETEVAGRTVRKSTTKMMTCLRDLFSQGRVPVTAQCYSFESAHVVGSVFCFSVSFVRGFLFDLGSICFVFVCSGKFLWGCVF